MFNHYKLRICKVFLCGSNYTDFPICYEILFFSAKTHQESVSALYTSDTSAPPLPPQTSNRNDHTHTVFSFTTL